VEALDVTGHAQHGRADPAHSLRSEVLLSRLVSIRLLHPLAGVGRRCPSCSTPIPCPTAEELDT
jgi:hypothetical protein